MKKFFVFLFIVVVAFGIPGVGFSYTFSDNFNDGKFDEWTEKIGAWSVQKEDGTANQYLVNTNDDYGVIWKDDSFGVYQKIQVDAYFDTNLNANINDQIAHLRLRGTLNQGWDTGYLADFHPDRVIISNRYSGRDIISYIIDHNDPLNPFSYTGWYTLTFSVGGTGVDTHFGVWINGVQYMNYKYIDYDYSNSGTALDSGYVGLGRLIRYDNAQGYSSNTPVPEPATMILLSLGLIGVAGVRRKYKN